MTDTMRAIRAEVYASLADTGRAPSVAELAVTTRRSVSAVRDDLTSLHESHDLVLDGTGEVHMALPFSAVPTPFVVSAGGVDRWANCAWDALAVPLVIGNDATIHAEWGDEGPRFDMEVRDGNLGSPAGMVHFAVPARHWWDDIVET